MNLKDAQVPLLWVAAACGAAWGAYEWIASKAYVREIQTPLAAAVESLDRNVQAQVALIEGNAKIASRALSLEIAEDLSMMYNRLCYEDLDAETKRRAFEVIDRWLEEYRELTGREYEPGECD